MHSKILRTLFSKTIAIFVALSIAVSSCSHVAFASEPEKETSETTTYVVSENGEVVDTYIDITSELNNKNIESEPVEKNNNGADSIGAVEPTVLEVPEQAPPLEGSDDELKEQGTEGTPQDNISDAAPAAEQPTQQEDNNEIPEDSKEPNPSDEDDGIKEDVKNEEQESPKTPEANLDPEPDLTLFEQLLLIEELEDILVVLKDASLIDELNEFTEDEIKDLIEYLVKEFADEEDKEKLEEVLSLIAELQNAPIEDDKTETPTEEIPEIEGTPEIEDSPEDGSSNSENKNEEDSDVKNSDNVTPECEDSTLNDEITSPDEGSDDIPTNEEQSEDMENSMEISDNSEEEVPEEDEQFDEEDSGNQEESPSLYETALAVVDFEELYLLMTTIDNLVVMQEWTTEEIDSIILKALEYDDERLEEVLIILYELPNAPDMFITYEILDDGNIYFDLAAGNVTIKSTSYSGYVFVDGVAQAVSGTHSPENKYYVYQSNPTSPIETNDYGVPQWPRVTNGGQAWGNYITNNPDISGVVGSWSSCAQAVGRTSTPNYITVASGSTYDVTIDNIWSSYAIASTSRNTGGIGFDASGSSVLTVRLKGDSRVGNIFYASTSNSTRFIFENGEESLPGSITCASYNGNSNHYNSVIGGNDNTKDSSYGLVFNGGVIWAGAPTADNCSGIGGGGNGYGKVYINGGSVTSVVHSSGAAIGGGIGESSQGGDALVEITGGSVYAYNYGYVSNMSGTKYFIPGAAIGGGSSCKSSGNATTNITISGGYVYAQSLGGAAIGGGSSTMASGGAATVTITGSAVVEARSISGTASNGSVVEAGVSIGGGTAGYASLSNGGSITLNINGGTLYTGSVGGGGCNNSYGRIGSGTVTMTAGTMRGQVVMGAGAAANTFTMTGGTIDNTTVNNASQIFIREFGGAVSLESGSVIIDGGTIKNCTSEQGGAVYIQGGDFHMKSGLIVDCTATMGGAVYVNDGNMTMSNGAIERCEADYGGAVYVQGGDITMTNGSVSANTASENGGAFYVQATDEDVYITLKDGVIVDNTAGKHGGALGANAADNKAIHLEIGNASCQGDVNPDHDDDTCPQISNNTASDLGGAFCLHGDLLSIDIFCGHITDNAAIRNPGSNSLNQSGGVVTVYNGTIDPGLMIGGGQYIDNRLGAREITIRFWGNYEGAPETPQTVTITNGVTISFPIDTYGRVDHFLTGWSTSTDATGMYVPANGKYVISTEEDILDFYAVWDKESSYIVYIPDTLPIEESGIGTMNIRADLLYFLELSTLDIAVESNFILQHNRNSSLQLPFTLYSSEFGEHRALNSGDIAATFQYNNTKAKTISAVLDLENLQIYAGEYVGLLTFVVDYYVASDT